ncbi:MAG: deoxyguanosinetriphosphate triphosphohydrolase, partial [Pseudomonadota bacterium]
AARKRRYEGLRRVFGAMVEDVLEESRGILDGSGAESVADIRGLGRPVVRFSDAMFAELKEIRTFLFARMYRHPQVAKMREKSDRIVRDLFAAFMDDVGLLPGEWEAAAKACTEVDRARMVADYVAGMTDRFAIDLHRKLTGGGG